MDRNLEKASSNFNLSSSLLAVSEIHVRNVLFIFKIKILRNFMGTPPSPNAESLIMHLTMSTIHPKTLDSSRLPFLLFVVFPICGTVLLLNILY